MKFIGFIAGLLIMLFIIRLFDINFSSNEIKIYSARCKDVVKYNHCDHLDYTGSVGTYQVDIDRQRVISSVGGTVGNRFTKCVIKDKNNWRCSYGDDSADFGFNAGNYWETTTYNSNPIIKDIMEKNYYPSRMEYINGAAKSCGSWYAVCFLLFTIFD